MAEAAYTAAVAQIAKHDMKIQNRNNDNGNDLNRVNNSSDDRDLAILYDGDGAIFDTRKVEHDISNIDLSASIKQIWKSDIAIEDKLSETAALLVGEVDSLLQCGLASFNELDLRTRQLAQSKEFAETRSREAHRLQLIDEQNRASLSVS